MTTTSNKKKKYPNQKQLWNIWNGEEMIWRGKPKPGIEFKSEEETFARFALIFYGIFFIVLFYGTAIFEYCEKNNIKLLKITIELSVAFVMLFVIFKFVPNAIVNFFRQKTAYAFDDKGVYFKLWRWGDTRLHFIDFKEIEQIVCIEYQEGKGRIRLMPRKELFFKTYSFEIGRTHLCPTLEMVGNAVKVSQQMEKLRQMRITTTTQPTKLQ